MRNRLGGRIGSAALCSHTTNAVIRTAAAAASPMITGDPQAYWVPPHTVTSSADGDAERA